MTATPPKLPTMLELAMGCAASAAAAKAEAERPRWPVNPFPKGIREGSATDRVLQELRREAPKPLEHGQLRMRCNASRGAVNWATFYLINQGLIAELHDPRSPQYRRYRLVRATPSAPTFHKDDDGDD